MLKMNLGKTKEAQILNLMEKSNIQFVLTGSRFFDPDYPDGGERDWDFFTEDCEEARVFLDQNEFVDISKSSVGYMDFAQTQNIRSIWRRGNVDVQLVYDAPGKERIQKLMAQFGLCHSGTTKLDRKRLWQFAFSLRYTAMDYSSVAQKAEVCICPSCGNTLGNVKVQGKEDAYKCAHCKRTFHA